MGSAPAAAGVFYWLYVRVLGCIWGYWVAYGDRGWREGWKEQRREGWRNRGRDGEMKKGRDGGIEGGMEGATETWVEGRMEE